MHEVYGTILRGEAFEPVQGRVVVEDGRIEAIEEMETDSEQIVVPAFVNAHTHLGDSVAKEAAVGLGLEKAVVPPDSRKHRRLAAASRSELVAAMAHTLQFMHETGSVSTLDFREFGVDGATALREAGDGLGIDPFIFGSDEVAVLDVADGFGASGANDDDFSEERAATRERGLPFAIHAGEPNPTDIHPALDLEPDLLVHMVHAESDHLERVADQSVPIAVCPRANNVLDVGKANISELLEYTDVALGTDNVMLNQPSMFREMAYTAKHFDVTDREVLRMATTAGAEIAGLDCGVIEPGRRAALTVLDGGSHNLVGTDNPISAVVRRATGRDVEAVLSGQSSASN